MIAFEGHGSLATDLILFLQSQSDLEVYLFDQIVQSGNGKSVNIVIEATNFDLDKKKQNLQTIENYIASDTLILSSVLGLTATETASWLSVPERLVGFATFSPLELRNLIEISAALQTDDSYVGKASQFIQQLNKEVEIVQDEVGLVFPRILSLIINEATFALMEGTASAEDIDSAMQNGTNYPFGPLAWADNIGIDDVLAVLSGLQRELGEERYRPAPLIRKMLYAGYLGKKTGKGFYEYVKE